MKQTKKGFTLIELLIVIAIIGILAAIAIPQYARYRRNAQDAAAQSALHNIRLVQEALFAQNPKATNYVTNYKELAAGGLVKDTSINYGTITLRGANDKDNPGTYTVSVQHRAAGSTTFTYDSALKEDQIKTNKTAVPNKWTN